VSPQDSTGLSRASHARLAALFGKSGALSHVESAGIGMSRWVNGSLDELLTLAPGARHSGVHLRDPGRDDDEAFAPPVSDQSIEEIDRFLDELDADALDLSLRVAVLETLVHSLPRDRAARAGATLSAVMAVRVALDDVRARAADRRLSHFVAADAPLGAYVKVVHARAAATARALERLRLEDADAASFARDLADAATFRPTGLADAIRRDLGAARLGVGSAGVALRALRSSVEALFGAAARLDTLAS
jgi:hypothetical protein